MPRTARLCREALEGLMVTRREHRGAELTARRTSTGEVVALPILRDVLEKDGHWKLVHFNE